MHPFQDQINRMWLLIKLRIKANKQGFWLEVVDLSYVILEIKLRLLLTSKAGKKNLPIPKEKIEKQDYLMTLANLAKDNYFLNQNIWKKVKDFNKTRTDAIHGLAQGRISYHDLEDICKNTENLINEIQNSWLPITYGNEETSKD